MNIIDRRSGSALLLTLLVVAAVSSVVLAAGRGLITGSRSITETRQAQAAETMAAAGLRDGIARYRQYIQPVTPDGPYWQQRLSLGEYGDKSQYQSDSQFLDANDLADLGYLGFQNRGYLDEACSILTVDFKFDNAASIGWREACPTYKLRLRDSRPLASGEQMILTDEALNPGNATILPVRRGWLADSQPISLKLLVLPGDQGAQAGSLAVTGRGADYGEIVSAQTVTDYLVLENANIAYLEIVPSLDFQGRLSLINLSASQAPIRVGQGYVSVEAAGYAGAVYRAWQLRIYENYPIPLVEKRPIACLDNRCDDWP